MTNKLTDPQLSELYHFLFSYKNVYLYNAVWHTLTAKQANFVDPKRYAKEMHNLLHGSVDV